MKRGLLIVLALVATSFVLIAYSVGAFQPRSEHRFRITIEVMTPDGVKQGSSVWSVTCTEIPRGAAVQWGGCKNVYAQAIFVDLGSSRNVVGLVEQRRLGTINNNIAHVAYGDEGVPRDAPSWYRYAQSWRGARPLRGDNMLTLATIRDLNDPASVKIIDPLEFNAVFGPGYALQAATLEIVPSGHWPLSALGLSGTPITTGIENKIPFLVSHREALKSDYRNRFPAGMHLFSTGRNFGP